MRKFLLLTIGCGLAAMLSACGHAITLTPLDGGEPGVGGTAFYRAPLMIKIDGKVYHGHWRTDVDADELPQPSPVALPAAPIQVGHYYGQRGAGGYGVADFRAHDGSTVVCRFRYERGQDHGSGLCQTNNGRTFSLVID